MTMMQVSVVLLVLALASVTQAKSTEDNTALQVTELANKEYEDPRKGHRTNLDWKQVYHNRWYYAKELSTSSGCKFGGYIPNGPTSDIEHVKAPKATVDQLK